MPFSVPQTLLTYALMMTAAPALAIYKCEYNGKIAYSDRPCIDGKTIELAEKVTVTNADRRYAQKRLAQDKATTARIEKERRKREAAEEKEAKAAARIASAKQAKCSSLALRVKWSEEDAMQASGKSAPKAKIKAKRMQEQYEMQCKT